MGIWLNRDKSTTSFSNLDYLNFTNSDGNKIEDGLGEQEVVVLIADEIKKHLLSEITVSGTVVYPVSNQNLFEDMKIYNIDDIVLHQDKYEQVVSFDVPTTSMSGIDKVKHLVKYPPEWQNKIIPSRSNNISILSSFRSLLTTKIPQNYNMFGAGYSGSGKTHFLIGGKEEGLLKKIPNYIDEYKKEAVEGSVDDVNFDIKRLFEVYTKVFVTSTEQKINYSKLDSIINYSLGSNEQNIYIQTISKLIFLYPLPKRIGDHSPANNPSIPSNMYFVDYAFETEKYFNS